MANHLKPELLQLAQLAISAVHTENGWREYLKEFSNYFTASVSCLSLYGNSGQADQTSIYYGFSTKSIRDFESRWMGKDPWLNGHDLSSLPVEKVVPSQKLCSDLELTRSGFYRDFLAPLHLHYGGGVNYRLSPEASAFQILLRPRELGPLDEDELADWNLLVPYVRASLQSTLEQARLRAESEIFDSHFDGLGTGLLFLTATARITRCNATASEILKRRRDILIRQDRLHFKAPQLQAEFKQALDGLSSNDKTRNSAVPWRQIALGAEPMTASGPLLALLTPVTSQSRRGFEWNTKSTLMYLLEPLPASPVDPQIFERLFHWTPTEASLAALLSTGLRLEEAAKQLDINVSTARSHLKAIFAKTNFTRQGELIAFINRLVLRAPVHSLRRKPNPGSDS